MRGIENGFFHFGIDFLERVVNAVVIMFGIVDRRNQKHRTLDVRSITLRIDPRNKTVALFAEHAHLFVRKFIQPAVSKPARRTNGRHTRNGCVRRNFEKNFTARTKSYRPDGGHFGSFVQITRRIARNARPFIPTCLFGGRFRVNEMLSRANEICVIDVRGINGKMGMLAFSAVIDAQHAVSRLHEPHDKRSVECKTRFEQKHHGRKFFGIGGIKIFCVDFDPAGFRLSAVKTDAARNDAVRTFFPNRLFVQRERPVEIFPKRNWC